MVTRPSLHAGLSAREQFKLRTLGLMHSASEDGLSPGRSSLSPSPTLGQAMREQRGCTSGTQDASYNPAGRAAQGRGRQHAACLPLNLMVRSFCFLFFEQQRIPGRCFVRPQTPGVPPSAELFAPQFTTLAPGFPSCRRRARCLCAESWPTPRKTPKPVILYIKSILKLHLFL